MLVGTTGFGFSTTGGGGITSGFGGRSSMFFSTGDLICGGGSGGGVASGLEGGVDDCFGVAVAVILGCTTAAFLPLASSDAGGSEELLLWEVMDGDVVAGLASMVAVSEGAGGIDEVCECTTAAFISPWPTAPVIELVLAKDVRIEEGEVVVGFRTSNTLPPPTKPESEKTSDDDGSIDEVCGCSTTAFALPFGKPRLGIVSDIALVLEPLHDTVTECRGVTVTADKSRVRLVSPDSAVGTLDAGPISVLCPDCVPGVVVKAPDATAPLIDGGSPVNTGRASGVVLPDGVPVTPVILPPADDVTALGVPAVKPADCDVEAESESTLAVTLEDEFSPGMSSGKHSDLSGIEYEYNVCDHVEFAVSCPSPNSASISKSTSISTSLSSLIPVFKEPAPHTPPSS